MRRFFNKQVVCKMKRWIKLVISKFIDFLKWVWKECRDWRTLLLLGVVCLALSLPIWLFFALGFVFRWTWAFVVATAVWGFWMLPGAPFFALAVSITLGIKKIFEKSQKKRVTEEQNCPPQAEDHDSSDHQ